MGFFATLNGKPVARVKLSAPWTGPWIATVVPHDSDNIPSGAVTLILGALTLKGTVDPVRTGVFSGRATIAVRGGGGAWGKPVPAKKYHNDGTLRRGAIASDAAREVGETLVVASAADGTLTGVDFAREAAPASRVLEQLFPAVPWYVGADGITRVGDRTTRDVSAVAQMLELEHTSRRATIALDGDDVGSLLPGGSITDPVRLGPEPFVIHDAEIILSDDSLRATAWDRAGRDGILVGTLRQLFREADPRRTFLGLYRYRVYKMSNDRVELQIVKPTTGLPDVLPISIMPGVAGAEFDLTQGAVVLVQFIEGDPSLPVMTHATKKGDAGFLPQLLAFDAVDKVAVGFEASSTELGAAEAYVLRDGDLIKITGAVVAGGSGTVTGTIQLGTGTPLPPGPPPGGRSKVKA